MRNFMSAISDQLAAILVNQAASAAAIATLQAGTVVPGASNLIPADAASLTQIATNELANATALKALAAGGGVTPPPNGIAPVITSPTSVTISAATGNKFTVTTTGTPKAALSQTGLPTGATFADNGDGTATILVPPNVVAKGIYSLNLTANNGVTPGAVQVFTLTIN
jgi:hypothetical protein